MSPLSDSSKKRLIEDTEDWHPRTGTSQSRSFRILAQLTGTENGGYQLQALHIYIYINNTNIYVQVLSIIRLMLVQLSVHYRSFKSLLSGALNIFI